MNYHIGLDVSKASMNIHIPQTNQNLEIENSPKGLKPLHSKLKKIYKKHIDKVIYIFEPTGSYSELLKRFCVTHSILAFIINPKQFANYAKALGREVKNDFEDAKVLATAFVLAKEGDIAIPCFDKDVERMKELMSYYKFTTKQTTQLKNHLEAINSKDGGAFTIKDLKKSIKQSQSKEKKILAEVKKVIQTNETYKEDYQNIISIMGVGEIAAIILLHLFLKYPNANQRQITSLVGLNPIYKQSGTSVQSKYKISKSGSKLYRGSLFMATMSAIHYDKNMKAYFDRLKAIGKHTTQA